MTCLLTLGAQAHAAGWFACGNITQIGWSCQLASYPSRTYEYGIAYNSTEPQTVDCTYWNYGMRIYNRDPYMTNSDNPLAGSNRGGFLFYTGTLAGDDDYCSAGAWRHQYWALDANNKMVINPGGNGCYGASLVVYCRAR